MGPGVGPVEPSGGVVAGAGVRAAVGVTTGCPAGAVAVRPASGVVAEPGGLAGVTLVPRGCENRVMTTTASTTTARMVATATAAMAPEELRIVPP